MSEKDPLIDLINLEINLEKGQSIDLNKKTPHLKQVGVGLGWDVNAQSEEDFDLDASVFMLGEEDKILNDKYFVFYNNLQSPDGSVFHMGDNRTGVGSGDDETVKIDLTRVHPAIKTIIFVVTIHEATNKQQHFGNVRNAFIRVYNDNNKKELAKFQLSEEYSNETAVEFGRLYRNENNADLWNFEAIGQAYNLELKDFVNKYYSAG